MDLPDHAGSPGPARWSTAALLLAVLLTAGAIILWAVLVGPLRLKGGP